MKHWEGETPSFEVPVFKIHEIDNCLYIYLAKASDLGGNNIPAPHQETHHKMHCVSSRLPLYFLRNGYIFVPQLSLHPHLLSLYLYFFYSIFFFTIYPSLLRSPSMCWSLSLED
jgi:hypothetical protein